MQLIYFTLMRMNFFFLFPIEEISISFKKMVFVEMFYVTHEVILSQAMHERSHFVRISSLRSLFFFHSLSIRCRLIDDFHDDNRD